MSRITSAAKIIRIGDGALQGAVGHVAEQQQRDPDGDQPVDGQRRQPAAEPDDLAGQLGDGLGHPPTVVR